MYPQINRKRIRNYKPKIIIFMRAQQTVKRIMQ